MKNIIFSKKKDDSNWKKINDSINFIEIPDEQQEYYGYQILCYFNPIHIFKILIPTTNCYFYKITNVDRYRNDLTN